MFKDITVIDLETTDTNPVEHRITEVAAQRFTGGLLIDTFTHLVFADQTPCDEAVKLNGLHADLLNAEGMTELRALRYLLHLTGNSVIVAHNAAFEISWLHQASLRLLGKPLTNDFLCTKTLAVALKAGSGTSYSLRQLTHDYGIKWAGAAHRALPDVVATKALLDELMRSEVGLLAAGELLNSCGQSLNKKTGQHYSLPDGLPAHAKPLVQ